jgi:MtN3 and saliva related transmembrane protein
MVLIIIGFIASFTSTISLVPQIYKTYKTKSVKDLSLIMLINFFLCSISWVVYGILTDTKSVLITNIIMTLFSLIMLVFKIKYQPGKIDGKESN